MIFADAVAYPFRLGFAEVYRRFKLAELSDDVNFIGAGKVGLTIVGFAVGVDMVNVAREAMMTTELPEEESPPTQAAGLAAYRHRMLPVCPREYRPGCGQTSRPCGLPPTWIRAMSLPVRVFQPYTSPS